MRGFSFEIFKMFPFFVKISFRIVILKSITGELRDDVEHLGPLIPCVKTKLFLYQALGQMGSSY